MSDLAAGGSDPEIDAGGFATAEAPGSRGGEPLGPGTGHTWVNVALCAGVPVVTEQGLDGGGDISTSMLRSLGVRFMPEHNGGRRETDQHVPRLEDPWDQGELTVTFTPLASRRGSSTDFGP